MRSYRKIKSLLLVILLFITWLSFLQFYLNIFVEKPLHGDVTEVPNVIFTPQDWFSGEFQEKKEQFLNANFGFRNTFIRINNQIDFTLYNKINAKEIIAGKEGYMYEITYINTYLGKDYKNNEQVQSTLDKLNLLNDTLTKLNKTLLVVIAPGKANYYSEYIPDYLNTGKKISNYDAFSSLHKNYSSLNLIDFSAHFRALKPVSPYPLFPKFGIHWGPYGVALATDSILRYIETERNIILRKHSMVSVELKEAHGVDYDIGDGMNLLFRLGSDLQAYPVYDYIRPEGHVRPKLFVISDSFYWNFYDQFNYTFEENAFWYYNIDIKKMNQSNPSPPSVDEVRNQVLRSDIIMIMASESKPHELGWGFLDIALQAFQKQN